MLKLDTFDSKNDAVLRHYLALVMISGGFRGHGASGFIIDSASIYFFGLHLIAVSQSTIKCARVNE